MKRIAASHAHTLEDKAARRAAILQAANVLFAAGERRLPKAAKIASATGLAKGTVYLYFRTKEETFAALLLEGWVAVMQESAAIFETEKGTRAVKVNAFVTSLVAYMERHPEILYLDALGYGVLERNMSRDMLTGRIQPST